MTKTVPPSPPSYIEATGSEPGMVDINAPVKKGELDLQQHPPTYAPVQPQPNQAQSGLHYYRNPVTGHQVASPFGPKTPQGKCLMQGHMQTTKYGALGIVAGILLFPWGLLATAVDRKVVCKRCKQTLEPGFFNY